MELKYFFDFRIGIMHTIMNFVNWFDDIMKSPYLKDKEIFTSGEERRKLFVEDFNKEMLEVSKYVKALSCAIINNKEFNLYRIMYEIEKYAESAYVKLTDVENPNSPIRSLRQKVEDVYIEAQVTHDFMYLYNSELLKRVEDDYNNDDNKGYAYYSYDDKSVDEKDYAPRFFSVKGRLPSMERLREFLFKDGLIEGLTYNDFVQKIRMADFSEMWKVKNSHAKVAYLIYKLKNNFSDKWEDAACNSVGQEKRYIQANKNASKTFINGVKEALL